MSARQVARRWPTLAAPYDPQLDCSATTWHVAMRNAAARARLRMGRQRVRTARPGEEPKYGCWVVQTTTRPPARSLDPAGRATTPPPVAAPRTRQGEASTR